ncbi:MAG: M23 family metallopeptidase [Bacteriovoracaceae bacterium]|nr:M23 family metallopeptidase [Bacteriovoracaceae bacterium]
MFKTVILSFFVFMAVSCSIFKGGGPLVEGVQKEGEEPFKFKLRKMVIYPGHVKLAAVELPIKVKPLGLNCNGRQFAFWQEGKWLKSYIVEKMSSKIESFGCVLKYQYGKNEYEDIVLEVKVQEFQWQSEELTVIRKLRARTRKEMKRIEREWLHLKKVYSHTNEKPYFYTSFIKPLSSFVTSVFGKRRIYNKSKESQHSGVDFRAKVGTPIEVSNSGRVVYVGDLFFTGNTVIVDHGVGIFTIYAHLSKFKTVTGEYVPKGSVVGLAGMTGRVTGPHLHWGVKIHGINSNGLSLVQAGY